MTSASSSNFAGASSPGFGGTKTDAAPRVAIRADKLTRKFGDFTAVDQASILGRLIPPRNLLKFRLNASIHCMRYCSLFKYQSNASVHCVCHSRPA